MSKNVSITNHDVVDGEPKIIVRRRSPIKLSASPQIAIAIPCGDKHEASVLSCPSELGGCGKTWMRPAVRQPNLIPVHLMLAHMNMIQPLNCSTTYMVESGRLSAEARQIMTKQAMRMGAKYILYWDDDTLPPPLGLYTLHNWMERHPEAGAISGVYTTREETNEPLIYTAHGAGAAWEIPIGPGAEPVPIFGAGAGFLLARVEAIESVIESMKVENGGEEIPIWADERTISLGGAVEGDVVERPSMWGHDVRFCKLLNEHDWPVYVHGEVLCGHHDIATGKTFHMPEDSPGWTTKPNSRGYWDAIYTAEGANTWRTYPEMFDKVTQEVVGNLCGAGTPKIVELGCGVGILGQRLVGGHAVRYKGYDISDTAVEIAQARFLDAERLDLRSLRNEHLNGAEVVVATEVMEHLEEEAFHLVVQTVTQANETEKFVFTVPDNCMGPEEVPEHTALFNEELVRERVKHVLDRGWSLSIDKADEHHLICVLKRKE